MATTTSTLVRPPRVRLSRARGWRMPAGTIKVDRTTRWGNPFDYRQLGRVEAIRRYIAWINGEGPDERPGGRRVGMVSRAWVLGHLPVLAGHPLACWCPPSTPGGPPICHADVLLDLANPGGGP
ncbi:protein of unknown function (DUF4326) [Frankia sp. EI5c]|uniref:DUF4326 domain-containing protein n=1 Tax=Frankia sp. EI5c TaxID=683316 RepID=UPI0007C31E2A|nr:DUF4326 domain-containing protein [Frankia sp. EI5c]OAA26357.1 protein of unknown function (DUF4326) [Frankia sp. EI5c]